MQTKFERDIHQTQKMLEGLLPPRHIQDALDASNRAVEHMRMQEKYNPREVSASLDLHNDDIQRAVGMAINNKAMLRAADFNSITQIAKYFESHLKPMTEHQKMLDMLRRHAFGGLSATDFARQLELIARAFEVIGSAKKSLDGLWPNFCDIDLNPFNIGGEVEQEYKKAAEIITQEANAQGSLQAIFEFIVLTIKSQKKPTVRVLLLMFFMKLLDWIFSGIVGAVIDDYRPLVLDHSPQSAKKAVLENARTKVGTPQLLEDYRYITAKVLIVRQNPRASSPEIGRLSFGKTVKLHNKVNDFAFVRWTDEAGDAEIQGWVFSRYLGKFN